MTLIQQEYAQRVASLEAKLHEKETELQKVTAQHGTGVECAVTSAEESRNRW
jgi:hypothetical protein